MMDSDLQKGVKAVHLWLHQMNAIGVQNAGRGMGLSKGCLGPTKMEDQDKGLYFSPYS